MRNYPCAKARAYVSACFLDSSRAASGCGCVTCRFSHLRRAGRIRRETAGGKATASEQSLIKLSRISSARSHVQHTMLPTANSARWKLRAVFHGSSASMTRGRQTDSGRSGSGDHGHLPHGVSWAVTPPVVGWFNTTIYGRLASFGICTATVVRGFASGSGFAIPAMRRARRRRNRLTGGSISPLLQPRR